MHRRGSPVLTALACLAALSLAACDRNDDSQDRSSAGGPVDSVTGTGTGTGTGTDHPETVRAAIASLYAGDDPSPEEAAESTCFADAFLDRVAPDGLVEARIVQDGAVVPVLPRLDEPTAEAWVGAQEDCTDFVEVSTRAVGAQSKGKVDADAYAACLREALTPDQVHAARVSSLTGGFDTPEVAALGEAQADCVRSASPSD